MVSSLLYPLLVSRPPIQSFEKSAPDIVGVGGSRTEYSGFIDLPLEIAGVEVAHPLLVVSNLPFQILIGSDNVRRHDATVLLGDECPLQLHTRVFEICLEQRDESNPEPRSKPDSVCAIDEITKDTKVRDRARSLNAAPPALNRRPPTDVTAIANFFRPTENLESEIVSRAAISKTLSSAATVVARSCSRLLPSASECSVSVETLSTNPTPITASRDFAVSPPMSIVVESVASLSDFETAALPSGVETASLPSGVETVSLPSGVETAPLPSGVVTAPPPSAVGTAAPLSGVDIAALPFVVNTAAFFSGVETAALPSGVDTESEYAPHQPSSAPPSIRVQTSPAAEISAVSEARSTTVAEPESPRTLLRSAARDSVVAVSTRTRARTRTRTCTCTSTCTCTYTRTRTRIRPSRVRFGVAKTVAPRRVQ